MVKSKQVYSPQKFVDAVTGHCYYMMQDDTVTEIHNLLRKHGIETDYHPLRDYPLDEITHIVENNIPVVLVDVSGFNANEDWVTEYRWFEVPAGFCEEIDHDE